MKKKGNMRKLDNAASQLRPLRSNTKSAVKHKDVCDGEPLKSPQLSVQKSVQDAPHENDGSKELHEINIVPRNIVHEPNLIEKQSPLES